MKVRNRRKRLVKFPVEHLRGRQGRSIYDELADELPPVPTVFEQEFPFDRDWPKVDMAIEPVGEKDDAFVELEPWEEVQPPTDEELVDFWADQARQHEAAKRVPRRGPGGRFVKTAEGEGA